MHLSVGDVAVIGVMAHEQTHSQVSQSIVALWILQFWQGVIATAQDREKKNEVVENNEDSINSGSLDGLVIRERNYF